MTQCASSSTCVPPALLIPAGSSITAACGVASYAGIPLTHRAHASGVVFLTGHEDPAKPDSAIHWEDYARLGATLCLYMGMKNLETITRRLQAGGLIGSTPVRCISPSVGPVFPTVGRTDLEARTLNSSHSSRLDGL